MSRTAPSEMPPVPVNRNTVTSNGVSTMPIRLENEALQIAAATLPRAIEVNAIEDCTVDGRQHRNITPVYSPGVSAHGTNSRESKPSNGNSTNVASIYDGTDGRVLAPLAGNSEATATVNSNARM